VASDHPDFERVLNRACARADYQTYIYDEFKSLNGCRPRWLDWHSMSDEEIEEMAADIERQVKELIQREEMMKIESDEALNESINDPRGMTGLSKEEFESYQAKGEPVPNSAFADELQRALA